MKIQCEIIKDLIPLMEDDVCSAQSREAVLEHIQTCTACRELYEKAKIQPVFEIGIDEAAAQKSIEKGFRKVKRRWVASILLVILFVPIVYLSWGQFKGCGIAFTNINEILITEAFLRDLKQGDYEGAFLHIDVATLKEKWLDEWFDENEMKDIEEDGLRVFCESASLLMDIGGIDDYQYLAIDKHADSYRVYYTVTVNGKKEELSFDVTDKGILHFYGTGSFIYDPVAHFGEWTEYLWQEYEGCYFDAETGQYIYN